MRGKEPEHRRGCADCGITPAHAGKRRMCMWRWLRNEDHPRTCGEKSCVLGVRESNAGSPPHMRGKASSLPRIPISPRITPAHAGKRRPRSRPKTPIWDHPRTCGEKQTTSSCPRPRSGSPPHMRGKAVHGLAVALQGGITPAHAGKRAARPSTRERNRDHPRTCGEKHLCGKRRER